MRISASVFLIAVGAILTSPSDVRPAQTARPVEDHPVYDDPRIP